MLQLRLRREAIRTPAGGAVAGWQAAPTIPPDAATAAGTTVEGDATPAMRGAIRVTPVMRRTLIIRADMATAADSTLTEAVAMATREAIRITPIIRHVLIILANRAMVADNVLATGTASSVRTETTIGTAMAEGTAPVAAAALAAGMEMAVGTAVRGSNLAGFLPVASDLAPPVDVPPAGGKRV